MEKTCVAVVGTPRSGTSAVAGVLTALGIPMGTSAVPSLSANPKGFFEDRDFFPILDRAVGNPEDPRVEPTWPSGLLAEFRFVVARKAAVTPNWGLKDPRLCMALPDLAAVCDLEKIGLRIVVTSRGLAASAASLAKFWGGIGVEKAADLLGRHLVALDRSLGHPAVRHLPRMTVAYDGLVDNTTTTVGNLVCFTDAKGRIVDGVRWIDKSLRHF